jgi:hypothetical protein
VGMGRNQQEFVIYIIFVIPMLQVQTVLAVRKYLTVWSKDISSSLQSLRLTIPEMEKQMV